MNRIEVDLEDEKSRKLWKAVGDLVDRLPGEGALKAIDEVLRAEGFEPTGPDLEGFAHRYERGDLIVDVLANGEALNLAGK